MTFSVHHHQKKNDTNTKTKTQRKTNTLKKTKAKYRKDHTCAIFSKSRWRKDIKYDILSASAEMEKRADGVDASVLIFSLCCANFLAVNGKKAKTFDFSTVLFFA